MSFLPAPMSVAAVLFAAIGVGLPGLAGATAASAQAEALYRQDRAACLNASAHHERSLCLREAAAVRAEARRGQRAPTETADARLRNALQRCVDLTPEHQRICERMVRGEGQTSGSVDGGGLLRTLETEVILPSE